MMAEISLSELSKNRGPLLPTTGRESNESKGGLMVEEDEGNGSGSMAVRSARC